MKTIKEWLESIEDEEIRAKALRNLKNCEEAEAHEVETPHGNEEARSLSEALRQAFFWSGTPEDHEFWDEQCNKAMAEE